MRMRRRWPVTLAAIVALAACSSSRKDTPTGPSALIVVNAPFASLPSVAEPIARGVELAVAELSASGARVRVERLDNGGSPTTAVANVRKAVERGAVAIVDEGTGVDASWSVANAAGVPIGIVYQGGASLVDLATRPNVFRITPTDRGVAFRLAEYLVPKGLRIALVHDDTAYGRNGDVALAAAFARNQSSVVGTFGVPSAGDPAPQLLDVRTRGATAVIVWASPVALARVVRTARATGWAVPIYAATSGVDPLVRQQLSDHPDWVEGLTFAFGRLTSEKGPGPFEQFEAAYEKRFGPDRVGVRSGGRDVIQPADRAMYSYDFVRIVAAALAKSGTRGPGLVQAMRQVEVLGANGDERAFNERNHEGVVDDDVAFAAIRDMVAVPVNDDPLSATLPTVRQTIR
jgi:ABC-type branched-subunit amino acid transport system substrate-binding protein